ncbi:MAG: DNA polymerase III subunit gamma/tau, partial [Desulfobacterales bacterium]
MAYQVLARKYRPQRFDQVVRQEHITRTLTNAVASGRLAHAILFAGPRGTGKTTVARILAKCVNCAQGPTVTPCDECRSCIEIRNSHATDVFEIDGASNNKVEHIRELRENARYMPAHSPYKIYIVDEVHMLSDAAFNALLKILEEPPAHVMFFFATTEPNKIPITILSRCQRHDFRRVEIDALIAHMSNLCQAEGIDINEEGLSLVAREADGSVRDALSLLDHIMACALEDIDTQAILDVLGGIDRRDLFAVSGAVLKGDAGTVLELIDSGYRRGQHMMKLFTEIIAHFRNLLVVKMGGGAETLADIPKHEREAIEAQVADIPATYLNQILDVLFKEETAVKYSTQPKLALEMAFLRILQIKPALSFDTLIEKLDLLRQEFHKNGAAADISSKASPNPAQTEQRPEPPSESRGHEAEAPPPGQTADRSGSPAESIASVEPPADPAAYGISESETATGQTQTEPGPAPSPEPPPETPDEHWRCILEALSEN